MKTALSAREVIVAVFSVSHGMIYIEYLKKGQTVINRHYECLFDAELQEPAPLAKKKRFSSMPPAHNSLVAAAEVRTRASSFRFQT